MSANPKDILTWVYKGYMNQDWINLAIGAGAAYYYTGVLPWQADMMMLAQGYLVGGVAFYASELVMSKAGGAAMMM